MFKRYWVTTDRGDPLDQIGSGYRIVEYDDESGKVRAPHLPDLQHQLRPGEWLHIPHIEAHEEQTITDVTRGLRAFKPKD